jgi:hypothetical protein
VLWPFVFNALKIQQQHGNLSGLVDASNPHNKEAVNFPMFRFLDRNSASVPAAHAQLGRLPILS